MKWSAFPRARSGPLPCIEPGDKADGFFDSPAAARLGTLAPLFMDAPLSQPPPVPRPPAPAWPVWLGFFLWPGICATLFMFSDPSTRQAWFDGGWIVCAVAGAVLGGVSVGGLALATRLFSGFGARLAGGLALGVVLLVGCGAVLFAGCVCVMNGGALLR